MQTGDTALVFHGIAVKQAAHNGEVVAHQRDHRSIRQVERCARPGQVDGARVDAEDERTADQLRSRGCLDRHRDRRLVRRDDDRGARGKARPARCGPLHARLKGIRRGDSARCPGAGVPEAHRLPNDLTLSGKLS